MSAKFISRLGVFSFALSACISANAQTSTDPVGVVKVTIAAAPANGTKLTAISATLRGAIAHQGTATSLGAFNPDAGSNPPNPDQALTQTGAGWTTNQWTTEPHLCYIENAAGAEEAYLIKSHTADELTLATSFDFFSSRYPSGTPTFRICKANTIGSLFGTTSATVPFKKSIFATSADNIYTWEGNGWATYYHNGTIWKKVGGANSSSPENDVVFPDEGLFILRRETSDITLTFSGSVPLKDQVSTITASALTFASTRYPLGSTIEQLGFHNNPTWKKSIFATSADKVYLWSGNGWITYYHNGTTWKVIAPSGTSINVNAPLPADSAIFVERGSVTDDDPEFIHTKPTL